MAGRGNRKLCNDALDSIKVSSDNIKTKLNYIQNVVNDDYPQITALLKAGYETMKVFDEHMVAALREIF
jgi:hypothetical protein